MAFLTAYLAFLERRKASRRAVFSRTPFAQLGALVRVTGETFMEAQELRRTLNHKYPFIEN